MTLSNKREGGVKKSTKFSDVIYECPMCLCVGPFCHYCRHVCFSHHILLASIIIILSAQHAQHSLCTTSFAHWLILVTDGYSRDRPTFFDQVGHETMYASNENKHFFTKSCHRYTYQNYEQPPRTSQNSYFQSHFSV